MDKAALKERLVTEYGYPDFTADGAIDQIERFSPEWKTALEAFLSDGKLPDTVCEGYTVQGLAREMEMPEIGAFLTMDALMKDPKNTLEALAYGIR
jgi:hypothetical protein